MVQIDAVFACLLMDGFLAFDRHLTCSFAGFCENVCEEAFAHCCAAFSKPERRKGEPHIKPPRGFVLPITMTLPVIVDNTDEQIEMRSNKRASTTLLRPSRSSMRSALFR
eukprot:3040004-Amphidinium_carterae.1